MSAISRHQLAAACDCPMYRAVKWLPFINEAMAAWGIDTPTRQAAFLAQVAHESGRLVYVRELWGPTPAQTRYEGRKDLGNVQPGDGLRYRGRGLIQCTGRANYVKATEGMSAVLDDVPDFEVTPEAMEQPRWSAHSAGWFWRRGNLNGFADSNEFTALTRRINGGTNGLADRQALWAGALTALGTA